jgi:hypothetical protein
LADATTSAKKMSAMPTITMPAVVRTPSTTAATPTAKEAAKSDHTGTGVRGAGDGVTGPPGTEDDEAEADQSKKGSRPETPLGKPAQGALQERHTHMVPDLQ